MLAYQGHCVSDEWQSAQARCRIARTGAGASSPVRRSPGTALLGFDAASASGRATASAAAVRFQNREEKLFTLLWMRRPK